ncbi:hypothetical protein [Mariprofundus ferrinatatus]|uniref:hypothetical protein n=1 Tax=Mariprofundus ferrinatatus TaxID=1921087 RepID=UPI0018E28AD3|nr:hypothetical protein [Mariprofundus ferrinatatus]
MCRRVPDRKCDPGMKGCTLSGRFTFSSSEKNISRRLKDKPDQTAKEKKTGK